MSTSPPYRLLVLAGPTASGKTSLAVKLGKHFRVPVLSADARQFYREMQVGTARPKEAELEGVPHYFLGNISIHDTYTAADFEREVHALLPQLAPYPFAILCGGSGLFIDAVIHGLDPQPPADPALRAELQQLLEKEGTPALASRLKILDAERWANIDRENPQRLIRAIEIASALQHGWTPDSPAARVPLDVFPVLIDWPREVLYDRINRRVVQMIQKGLEQEVRQLYEFRSLNALQTVGYSEMLEYIDGKISLEKAIALIQQHTRNYAKRQLTWFRKFLPDALPVHPEQADILFEKVNTWLK